MGNEIILELKNVSKHFGSIQAVSHVDFSLRKGEIIAILGENGSGKTSLMNIVDGIYFPDEGEVFVNGQKVRIASPIDANKLHIGMIHQHFMLVENFTGVDNILLGSKTGLSILKMNRGAAVKAIADKYGFEIDLNKKISAMSVSERQTVEIIKTLYHGADVLILDEPTAVLTPQEIRHLFKVIKEMRNNGKSIIIITHKMNEVMDVSDRVAIMTKGKHIATVETKKTNPQELADMMVGKKVDLNIERSPVENPVLKLEVKDLCYTSPEGINVLKDISFNAYGGEILGIAGIAGSGQKELLESIAGLHKHAKGSVFFHKSEKETINLEHKKPAQIRDMGIHLSFVPEDRLGMGLVGTMDITDNVMLRSYSKGKSTLVDRKNPEALAEHIIETLQVKTPSVHQAIGKLSGGNVQKVLVGREIAAEPIVLMTAYPVRGLDINTSYMIYDLLNEQKKKGAAVIFVGEDLDVLLALSDRLLVINDGRISGIVDARKISKEEVGILMTKNMEEA